MNCAPGADVALEDENSDNVELLRLLWIVS